MEPKLTYVEFKGGVNRELTRTAGDGSWYDADKVRFRSGKPEKIGGWININGTSDTGTFAGISRALTTWSLNNGTRMAAMGTHLKLQLLEGGTYYDITPIRTSVAATNVINTTANSNIVLVSLAGHGAAEGDYVIFTGTSVTVGGNVVLNSAVSGDSTGIYAINSPVSSSDTFNVTYSASAAATSATAGGAITIRFPIAIGLQSAAAGFGYGVGPYGGSTWGTVRSTSLPIALRTWSLDTFGEDLVANPRGGRIYIWDATGGTAARAVVVTASPSVSNFILTADQARHLVSFGCTDSSGTFDPLNIRWCSDGNLDDWVVSATNTAGETRLSGSNEIVGALRSAGQILVWTDNALYGMSYSGTNSVFNINVVGNNCGLIGPHAAVEAGGRTYWMAPGGFYVYDGAVRPLECDVFHYVFDNLNHTQGKKIFAGINSEWNEVLWLYQSNDSTTGEIDKYVIYNYVEKTWTIGTLTRTAWTDEGIFESPVAAGTDGKLYLHEVSCDADGSALPSYLESHDFEIGDGDNIQFIDRIVPDFEMTGELSLRIKTRKYPGSSYTTKGPYAVSSATPKISMRARGRQAAFRVDTSTAGDDWRLGTVRLQMRPDGRQ